MRFWHDKWYGNQTLNLELFAIVADKDASVDSYLESRTPRRMHV